MARKQKTIHYIYKTTCIITGRYYIGMHSTCDLEDGYMGSGKRLRYSIRKHGIKNHIKEVLEFLPDREKLKKREEEIVNSKLVKKVNCMNLVIGGGGFMLDDYHYKCSKAGNKSFHDKRKNDLVFDKKWRNKISIGNTDKKRSDETKKKLSKLRKGVSKTIEHKIKIGLANSIKQKGKLNSQYGTCWITKNGVNKKIKKERLKNFINKGWDAGKTVKRLLETPDLKILKEEIKNGVTWCSKKYGVSRRTINRWLSL